MIWLSWLLFFQGHYYIDGVEIHLRDGTIIKTAAEIVDERLFYRWEEDGMVVSVEKNKVSAIRYFSMRVKGRPPVKHTKTLIQRRISGKPVTYKYKEVRYFKFRHVDDRGRTAEGRAPNQLKQLKQIEGESEGYHTLEAVFAKTVPGTRVSFRFYNLEGRIMAKAFAQIKEKPEKTEPPYRFSVPNTIDLDKLGLVEVVTIEAS